MPKIADPRCPPLFLRATLSTPAISVAPIFLHANAFHVDVVLRIAVAFDVLMFSVGYLFMLFKYCTSLLDYSLAKTKTY